MSSHPLQTRRRFLGQAVAGAVAAGTMVTTPALAVLRPRVRRIAVMSDLHIGIKSRGIDGAQWLTRAIDDLNRNLGSIDYGLTLGDITHDGDRRSLIEYLELRDKSRVPRWFELAGNHDHHRDGIANYGDLVRAPASYTFIDGNVAWIFVSAENNACPGDMSRASLRWLREQLAEHQDKVIILCSHQLPPHTVRRSNEYIFSMQPRNEIAGILESHPIALHLCGHEHHSPYSSGCIATRDQTTVINAASINSAYDTGESGSIVLELEDGARKIVARRRSHDRQLFRKRFEVRIPLRRQISLEQRM